MFDKLIRRAFKEHSQINYMMSAKLLREMLHTTLLKQMSGKTSPDDLYAVALFGGFMIDGRPGYSKQLTTIGKAFMEYCNDKR